MAYSSLENIPSFKRNSISTDIAELITNLILMGEIKPGDKIPTEVEFTHQLGVGRNSVREAIKMLTFVGILEIRRGEGTFVSKKLSSPIINPLLMSLVYEEKTAEELVQLRLLLDIAVIPTIIANLTEDGIKQLNDANEAMYAVAKNLDYDKDLLLNLDIQFHKVYHSLTKNRLLVKIYETIYMLFMSSVKESLNNDPDFAYNSHKGLIGALQDRDAAKVEKNLRESLYPWESVVMKMEQRKVEKV